MHLAQRLPCFTSATADPRVRENMRCFCFPEFETSVTALATKCMLDPSFKALPASAIATGIIYFTRESYMCTPVWTPTLSALCGHDAPSSKSVQKVLDLLDIMTHDELLASGNLSQSSQNLEDSLLDSAVEEPLRDLALGATATSSTFPLSHPAYQHYLQQQYQPEQENDENAHCSSAVVTPVVAALEFTTPAMKAADVAAGKKKFSPVSIADFSA